MLGEVEVLLSHEDALAEEVLVDLLSVSFWDKPCKKMSVRSRSGIFMYSHCCEFLAHFGESHTTLELLGICKNGGELR